MRSGKVAPLVLYVGLQASCTPSRFVPIEPISVTNAGRLDLAYSENLAPFTWERFHPDPGCPLGEVAIDSSEHLMFVHRHWWTGLRSGPVGVHTIDLKTGAELRSTRFPSDPGMTGAKWGDTSYSFFVPHRHLDVYETGFMGTGGVVLLDLDQDDPHLIAHGPWNDEGHYSIDVVPFPFVDQRTVLLLREQYVKRPFGPSHLFYFELISRRKGPEYDVAVLNREFDYVGGIRRFILAQRPWPRENNELQVLTTTPGHLEPYAFLRRPSGWQITTFALDVERSWWMVVETDDRQRQLLRVYRVPDLDVVMELRGDWSGSLGWIGSRGMLVQISRREPHTMVLYALSTGVAVARIPLGRPDYAGRWRIVTDPRGYYVGVSGCQRIKLFAIRPQGSMPSGSPVDVRGTGL